MFENFIKKLEIEFKPEKILLFGSRASGSFNDESDYDVLVVMDSNEKSSARRAAQILDLCHPGDISIDLVVKTPDEIKKRIQIGDPFINKIINSGQIIYERNH